MIVREIKTLRTDPVKRDQEQYVEGIAGLDDALAERIVSRPATGQRQVFSIAWDPVNEELIIEISSTDTA